MPLEIVELVRVMRVRRRAEQHKLTTVVEAVMDGVCDERQTLLMIEPPNIANDGTQHVASQKRFSAGLVREFVVQRVDAVFARDVVVRFGFQTS